MNAQKGQTGRSEGPGYDDTRDAVGSLDGSPERTHGHYGYQAGQEVLYGGKIYTILATSDNGLYLGRVRGGESVIEHYVNGSEVRIAKW